VPTEGSKALWLFKESHPVRMWATALVTAKAYDHAMLAAVLVNCVMLAIESPLIHPHSALGLVLYWADVAFLVIFGAEAVIKALAFSFSGYLQHTTNVVRA
jgi:hypothetical protein